MVLLYIVFYYVMKYRKFGRYIYSIGGNEEATRLSGINVDKYKTLAYTVSGLCAGIASVILVAKLNSAQSVPPMITTPSQPASWAALPSPAARAPSGAP